MLLNRKLWYGASGDLAILEKRSHFIASRVL